MKLYLRNYNEDGELQKIENQKAFGVNMFDSVVYLCVTGNFK